MNQIQVQMYVVSHIDKFKLFYVIVKVLSTGWNRFTKVEDKFNLKTNLTYNIYMSLQQRWLLALLIIIFMYLLELSLHLRN